MCPTCNNKYIPIPYTQSLDQVRTTLNTFKLAGSKYFFSVELVVLSCLFHLKSMSSSAINCFNPHTHILPYLHFRDGGNAGVFNLQQSPSSPVTVLQTVGTCGFSTAFTKSKYLYIIFFVKKNNYNYTFLLISPHPQYSHYVNSGGKKGCNTKMPLCKYKMKKKIKTLILSLKHVSFDKMLLFAT